jgi:predicted transcriptional regulator of viral defense system
MLNEEITANQNKSGRFVPIKQVPMNKELQILFQQHGGYLARKSLSDRAMYNELLQLVKDGVVERLKQGVYHYTGDEETNRTMINLEVVVPGGVLCLYSAWAYYGLSTQIAQAFHVAIEKNRKVSLPAYPLITLYYWKREYQELGVVSQRIDGYTVRIYNPEKSVCDAVKFRMKIGLDVTAEILNSYLKRRDRNLVLLMEYARTMRIESVMRIYLETRV